MDCGITFLWNNRWYCCIMSRWVYTTLPIRSYSSTRDLVKPGTDCWDRWPLNHCLLATRPRCCISPLNKNLYVFVSLLICRDHLIQHASPPSRCTITCMRSPHKLRYHIYSEIITITGTLNLVVCICLLPIRSYSLTRDLAKIMYGLLGSPLIVGPNQAFRQSKQVAPHIGLFVMGCLYKHANVAVCTLFAGVFRDTACVLALRLIWGMRWPAHIYLCSLGAGMRWPAHIYLCSLGAGMRWPAHIYLCSLGAGIRWPAHIYLCSLGAGMRCPAHIYLCSLGAGIRWPAHIYLCSLGAGIRYPAHIYLWSLGAGIRYPAHIYLCSLGAGMRWPAHIYLCSLGAGMRWPAHIYLCSLVAGMR